MFTGNDPTTLTTWEQAQGITLSLGHQFCNYDNWSVIASGQGSDQWAAWVSAKAGRRWSCSLALAPRHNGEHNAEKTCTNDEMLTQVANGTGDAAFTAWAKKITSYPQLTNGFVRLGWEFNSPGHPWSITGGSTSSLALYKAAFTRVAKLIKTTCPTLLIEWCPNVGAESGFTFVESYPQEAHQAITFIGVGAYGYYWGNGTSDQEVKWQWLTEGSNNFTPNSQGLAHQVYLARAKRKRLAHTEWGLWPTLDNAGATFGDSAWFIKKLTRWHRIYGYSYEIYNNILVPEDKSSGTPAHDHRLTSYPQALAQYKLAATSGVWLPSL